MLDLDLLIVSSFHLLLLELGAVVSLPPSFIQFSQLDLPFNPCWLEIHFPPINCPMGSELKINWSTASFAIDQLVRCLSYRHLEGCSICPECLGYHAIPSFPHGIPSLLQNISDLLVRCFCLAIGLGMVLHPGGFTLNSLRPFLLVLSCEV